MCSSDLRSARSAGTTARATGTTGAIATIGLGTIARATGTIAGETVGIAGTVAIAGIGTAARVGTMTVAGGTRTGRS